MIEIKPDQERVLADAIETYGEDLQKLKAIEECAELIDVLSKQALVRANKEDVIEEIADVIIMAHQLAKIYDEMRVQLAIDHKIYRLENTLKKRNE